MNTRKGFTLVELLVVIAILAILATVSVVGYTSFIAQADKTALETDAANIEKVIEADLAYYGYCEIAANVVAVRKNGVVDFYTDKTATAKANLAAVTAFTHPQLVQFNEKTGNNGTYVITPVASANSKNATMTVANSKLTADDTVTITLD